MYVLSLAATTFPQWQATMVAALAHSPSIRAVTSAGCCSSRFPMVWAANTSPPPLLIRTTILSSAPSPASSSANCLGVTSSPHQLDCEMSPYSSSSTVPPAWLRNCQNFLLSGISRRPHSSGSESPGSQSQR